jgi:hypothetical protein
MVAVRVMQPPVHQIVDMVAMRHVFVPAARAVPVSALVFRRAAVGVGGVDSKGMFVDMVPMHMVQMTVVQIVDVAFVTNRGMPAVWTVLMGMIGMVLLGAGGHRLPSFYVVIQSGHCRSAACSIALCANRRA